MEIRETLVSLLKDRKDKAALEILREHPDLCDNMICRYALDHRCFSCIAFLRQNGCITLEGKDERDAARLKDLENNLEHYHELLDDIRKHLDI